MNIDSRALAPPPKPANNIHSFLNSKTGPREWIIARSLFPLRSLEHWERRVPCCIISASARRFAKKRSSKRANHHWQRPRKCQGRPLSVRAQGYSQCWFITVSCFQNRVSSIATFPGLGLTNRVFMSQISLIAGELVWLSVGLNRRRTY